MAPRRIPTFFKILLDPSAPHLTLPPAFVRRHLTNKIPEHPILRSVNGGYSWRLKIKRTGEIYYFSDGWSNVVEDSQLGFGDFLLFWLVDQSTFKLSIFSKSGCEKDFPSKIRVEHDDDEEEEEEDEVADEEDDDDEEEEEEEEEEDEDEEDEEEDDDDDEEEEEEILDGRGRGRGGVWRRSGGDEEEEEDDDDDDDGGDIDGHDGDPFFMTVISESNKFTMRLPMEFARLAGIDAETSITIKNLDGEESQVSVESDKCTKYCKFYLSSGWSDFRRVNKLSEGDKCVFTFIRSEDKLCLARVTKKTAPPKKPASKVPAVEVSKRSRGRSPPSVEVKSAEVTKRPRGRPKRPASKIPAVEVSKRTRGPPRVEVKNKDKGAEVMKKPRGKPKKTASKVPAVEVPMRTRGRPPRVEVESKAAAGAESMKKLRGRPAKRKRGRPRRV